MAQQGLLNAGNARGQQDGVAGRMYDTNHISRVKIPDFHGKENEDVLLWAELFTKFAAVSNWNDNEAIIYAELHMRDKAQQWLCGLDKSTIPTFAALYGQLVERFGESKTTLMTRLDHCKQGSSEPMRDYVDTVRLLYAKTGYPAEGQVQKFMAGLND